MYSMPKYQKENSSSDLLPGSIFTSLTDALEETLEPLDLSLFAMETAEASSISRRELEESDFLNSKIENEDFSTYSDENHNLSEISIQFWSDDCECQTVTAGAEMGMVEYEVECYENFIGSRSYCKDSPGSTGDKSDNSSDSGDLCIPEYCPTRGTMIELNPALCNTVNIKQEQLDYELDVTKCPSNEYMPHIVRHESKKRARLLPDDSILSHDHCRKRTKSDVQGMDDADDEQSDSSTEKSQSENNRRKRPGRKKGQTSSVYHLWEFIRDLLKDPTTCGDIIQWENKEEGIFKVIRSNEVAQKWGSKKKNKTEMTYEKLSRSLRYSRKEGYFADLPRNSGYPKKLCFKFGPKSHGWA